MNRLKMLGVSLAAALLVMGGAAAFLAYQALGEDASQDEALSRENFAAEMRATALQPPVELVDFSLPSTTGQDFTLSGQAGKVVLIFFGYTTCPDFACKPWQKSRAFTASWGRNSAPRYKRSLSR
ncbi:MAG: hypothetical protein HC915_04105 [Anaerolineae bacterium]|nr:hypothetical protein [Anaerolineae bacterium]